MMKPIRIAILVFVLVFLFVGNSWSQTFTTASGTQNWNSAGNWTPSGVPNGIGASATINDPLGANQNAALNAAITIGSLNMTNNTANTVTISNGTGSLNFQVASGNATATFSGTSSATNVGTISASVALGSPLVVTVNNVAPTGASGYTFTGAITGSNTFTKDGPGRLSFTNVSKGYTGATIVNQGRMRFTSAGILTGTSSVLVNSGGQLFLDSSAAAWTFGTGSITLNGTGTAETAANGGLGALRNNAGGTSSVTNNIVLGSASTIDIEGGTTTLSGAFSGGSNTLTKSGTGTVLFSNVSNSHTGNLTINGGTITYNSGVTIGGGAVTLAQTAGIATVALRFSSSQTIADPSTVWADTVGIRTQTIDTGASSSTVLTINQNNNTTFGNGAVGTITGVIAGSGSIVKNGAATLSLTGTNTYAGTTTINNGLIAVTDEAAFGAIPGSFTANQITLNGGGIQAITTAISFGTLNKRGITLGSSGGTFDSNGQGIGIETVITGTGSLTKIGTSSLSLYAANAYGGDTNVQNGTLVLYSFSGSSTNRLPTGTVLTLGSGVNSGSVSLGHDAYTGASDQTIAGLTTSGSGSANAIIGNTAANSTLTVNNSNDFTYSGRLGGVATNNNNLNLVKSGSGTQTLSGNNTYTGTTLISGGKLLVNGTHIAGGAYTVDTGGILGGNGTINANVNIVSGTLSPGNSPDRLTINGAVAFTNTTSSVFRVEINGPTVVTDYDQLRVGSAGSLNITGATLTASLGFEPVGTEKIFITDDLFSGAVTGTFNNLPEGAIINLTSPSNIVYSGIISYLGDFTGPNFNTFGGNDIVIYNLVSTIPEPGTIALLGLTGFFGLQWYLRRKPVVARKEGDKTEGETIETAPHEMIA